MIRKFFREFIRSTDQTRAVGTKGAIQTLDERSIQYSGHRRSCKDFLYCLYRSMRYPTDYTDDIPSGVLDSLHNPIKYISWEKVLHVFLSTYFRFAPRSPQKAKSFLDSRQILVPIIAGKKYNRRFYYSFCYKPEKLIGYFLDTPSTDNGNYKATYNIHCYICIAITCLFCFPFYFYGVLFFFL